MPSNPPAGVPRVYVDDAFARQVRDVDPSERQC